MLGRGFNSRPSRDGRQSAKCKMRDAAMFQFTPVSRRATTGLRKTDISPSFNSRPSRDGRHGDRRAEILISVSIHARLATGDIRTEPSVQGSAVSIHARLATGDGKAAKLEDVDPKFQFTPVSRRATKADESAGGRAGVSIHARLATGDRLDHRFAAHFVVSIHARLATGD